MNKFREAESERPWEDLQKLSVGDLISYHDQLAFRSGLGPEYYLEEIRYRRQRRLTRVMLLLTIVIAMLTGVVTVATLHNVFWNTAPPTQSAPGSSGVGFTTSARSQESTLTLPSDLSNEVGPTQTSTRESPARAFRQTARP